MSSWLLLGNIIRKFELEYRIEALEPLHIGSGKGSIFFPVDLPIIRSLTDRKPLILGSSLKGTTRSAAEYLCSLPSIGLNVCNLGACANKIKDRLDEALRSRNKEQILQALSELCEICKVFGSGSYSSRTIFSNALPEQFSIGYKAGTAINRITGTVKAGALYELEYLEAGSRFRGKITAFNIPNYLIGMLIDSIGLFNSGTFKLGAFKSRGFGLVKIDINSINVQTFKNGKPTILKQGDRLEAIDSTDTEVTVGKDEFVRAWRQYVVSRRS